MYNVSITSLDLCGQIYDYELYYGKPVIMKIDRAPLTISMIISYVSRSTNSGS